MQCKRISRPTLVSARTIKLLAARPQSPLFVSLPMCVQFRFTPNSLASFTGHVINPAMKYWNALVGVYSDNV